ncbi:hypothetical protein MMC31_004160, partial [Peltigera leucophlebia]|nr:hypothetical protein [Peltigera leucophlebia]
MSPQSWHKDECSPRLAGIPDLGREADSSALALHRRSWKSPIGSSSALYIFLGILITLVIFAPLLGLLRSRQRHALQERTRAQQRAEGNVQDGETELTSLRNIRETLAEEQQQHVIWRQDNEALLQEEHQNLKTTKQQLDDLERAHVAISNERDAAQERYELASRRIRNLEEQIRAKDRNLDEQIRVKDGNLADLQREYEDMQN